MGPKAVRKRIRSMAGKWQRDLAWLETHLVNTCDVGERSDPASETVRNLATAIAEARAFEGMTDFGVRSHMRGGEYDASTNAPDAGGA